MSASALLIIKLEIIYGIFRPSLINQKHNLGWFLLIRFVDRVKVYSLLVISKKHSNTFLLIDLQKTKIVQSKILKQGQFLLIPGFYRFRQVIEYLF